MITPACPRCGYDQTGAIALWVESCPISGTCPECGLDFQWYDVLHPESLAPKWSFEHKPTFKRFFRTSLVSLNPWRLWNNLRMEHPIRPARLLALALFGTLFIQILAGLVHWGFIWVWDGLSSRGYGWQGWRPPLGTFAWRWHAIGEAFFPYYEWSSWWSVYSYSGPMGTLSWLMDLFHRIEPWLFIGLAWWCLMPITFLLLPQTLQRARVRRAHVCRVFVYSLVAAPSMMAVYELADLGAVVSSLLARFVSPALALNVSPAAWMLTQLAAFALALTTFWALACSRYLKLPRAWFIAAAMTTLSLLASLVIALALPWHPMTWLGPLG